MNSEVMNAVLSWLSVVLLLVMVVFTFKLQKIQTKRLDRQVEALERIAEALESRNKTHL
jgi:hypothetical protein